MQKMWVQFLVGELRSHSWGKKLNWASGSPWSTGWHSGNGLEPQMAKRDGTENEQLSSGRAAVLCGHQSLPSVQWPQAQGWQLPLGTHSSIAPLRSLESLSACSATETKRFYSWVSSDPQEAAVSDYIVLAYYRMSLSHVLASDPLFSLTVTGINCYYGH